MIRFQRLFICYFALLGSGILNAQQDTNLQFGAPLGIPLLLAGNFGEIRPGHFHAGIDIKTQQVEGLPVLAAEDGFVSRIKISLGGYGNALYITHPNGYTTVYGHLKEYNESISALIRQKQYAQKKFTVELYFTPNQLPVVKGDTVALSGNSGGSGGPHLHFEIRKTEGSIPQNPLKFGFDIKDNIPPILKNLAMYPLNDTSLVNGKNEVAFFPITKYNGKYVLKNNPNLSARGVIGFGLEAIDKLNGASNRCGVYNITLKADSTTIYEHQMDEIGFDVTRFINTHVDFYETKKNKRRIQKSYLTTYNRLKIYKNVQNSGKVYFSKYGHDLHYSVIDAYNNHSSLNFQVDVDTVSASLMPELDDLPMVLYNEEFVYQADQIEITIPAYSFYGNLILIHDTGDTLTHAVSPVHYIQNLYTPLQKYINVSIKTPVVPKSNGNKFIAVSLTEKLTLLSPEGGTYDNGWVTFKTRSLGPYTVMQDTINPTITPINFKASQKNINTLNQLTLQAKDNLSGISTYNAYLDENWVLLEFDAKTGLLWIDLAHLDIEKGDHQLKITVGDAVNNFKGFSFNFIW